MLSHTPAHRDTRLCVCVCACKCVSLSRINPYLDSGVSEEMGILGRVRKSREMATLHPNALLCAGVCLFVYLLLCVCVFTCARVKMQSYKGVCLRLSL